MVKKETDKRIRPYVNVKNEVLYMYRLYVGIDEMTGKRQQTTRRGFRNLKEAEISLKRLEYEVSQGKFEIKKSSPKFIQVYKEWFVNYQKTVRESTWATTEILFDKHINPVFGDKYVDKIDSLFCQKQVNIWADTQPSNFKKYKNYVSNIFHYALTIDLIVSNPMRKITIPKGELMKQEQKEIEYYHKEQLKNFLEAASKYNQLYYTFFYLLAYTGLRKGEALALEWKDINYFKKEIYINKTVARGKGSRIIVNSTKTKAGKRIISVDQSLLKVLENWKNSVKIRQQVFNIESPHLLFLIKKELISLLQAQKFGYDLFTTVMQI